MTSTPAPSTKKPANLTALQLQLIDLAARSKQVPQDHPQVSRGPVVVTRGK